MSTTRNERKKTDKNNDNKINCCICATSTDVQLNNWLLEKSKENDGFVVSTNVCSIR
jgi:hypothetical protein